MQEETVKKILIALALMGLVATSAQADSYYRGHHAYHGGYPHSSSHFWWGAAFGAALSLPFYYAYTRSYADPYLYSYYNPSPVYYNPAPVIYVQNPPIYVRSQPTYTVAAPESRTTVITQFPSNNGVIELGPVNSQLPANSSQARPQGSLGAQGNGDQWFVYPSKGQNQQQVGNDRYECNRWATNESGYDPDLRTHRNPETGPVAYGRALSACLEGRGYTVR